MYHFYHVLQGRSNEFESGEATSGNLFFYTNVSMQVRDRMTSNSHCHENKFNVVVYNKTRIELFMTNHHVEIFHIMLTYAQIISNISEIQVVCQMFVNI